MFKLGALLFVLCLILIKSSVSSDGYSLCERRLPVGHNQIAKFKCPEEKFWFTASSFFLSQFSNSDKKYCCGTLENRFCCKKSQYKKELYLRQRSNNSMSLSGLLISFAVTAILICICCRCISMCFGKKRLNRGAVITSTSTSTQAGTINGQNVHVIGQPVAQQPNQAYQQNFYPPNQNFYPPTTFGNNQFGPIPYDYNTPPPPYNPKPIYKEETNQQSAMPNLPQPSAPEF